MESKTLRPYQVEAIEKLRASVKAYGNTLLVAPTGSGKSIIIAELCKRIIDKGGSVLVLAHRKELIDQNQKALGFGGVFCAGLNKKQIEQVTFATIGSAYAAKDSFVGIKAVIVDEAHRINDDHTGMYRTLISHLGNPIVLGLTATPFRLKGGKNISIVGGSCFFSRGVIVESVAGLIEQGYLSPLISRVGIAQANLNNIELNTIGDYDEESMTKEMLRIEDPAIEEIVTQSKDRKKIIVFCSSVAHAKKVGQDLCDRGIQNQVVLGESGDLFRDSSILKFRGGTLRCLVNCNIATEGLDVPDIDMVVLLRATKSLTLLQQAVGRGLRKADSKRDCLVLDYGNNFATHGTLDSAKIIDKGSLGVSNRPAPTKMCPKCRTVCFAGAKKCICGYEFKFDSMEEKLAKAAYEGAIVDKVENFVHEVKRISYAPYKTAKGKQAIVVAYITKEGKLFKEWVSFPLVPDRNWLDQKVTEWWHARTMERRPETRNEVLKKLKEVKTHPTKIKVMKVDGWDRITPMALGEMEVQVHTEEDESLLSNIRQAFPGSFIEGKV